MTRSIEIFDRFPGWPLAVGMQIWEDHETPHNASCYHYISLDPELNWTQHFQQSRLFLYSSKSGNIDADLVATPGMSLSRHRATSPGDAVLC